MSNIRLTPDKWLAAGFDALQELGPHAIAAEALARRLGTTKGSFYWHFRDVPAFQDTLLAQWQKTALEHLEGLPRTSDGADQKLRQFGCEIIADRGESALRVWAQNDARVAATLEIVDVARRGYLVSLLTQLGLGNPEFARALQATLVGLPQMLPEGQTNRAEPFDTLVDTVLALAES
jgi:AcrR family transcriptional regulator